MTDKCPLCASGISPENGPFVLDERGVPYAASVSPGFGVPWGAPLNLEVFLDGGKCGDVVAYDRERGLVWRYQTIDGHSVIRDGDCVIEQLAGKVEVKIIA